MNISLVVKNSVTINASMLKVWETLTSSEKTRQKMLVARRYPIGR